jgi:hypothetical protein
MITQGSAKIDLIEDTPYIVVSENPTTATLQDTTTNRKELYVKRTDLISGYQIKYKTYYLEFVRGL